MRLIDADKIYPDVITGATLAISQGQLAYAPTVEAIPKAEYEARLKTDMVAMLEEIKKEMNPIKECEYQIYGKENWRFAGKCQDVIQQKINALKAESEDNK